MLLSVAVIKALTGIFASHLDGVNFNHSHNTRNNSVVLTAGIVRKPELCEVGRYKIATLKKKKNNHRLLSSYHIKF